VIREPLKKIKKREEVKKKNEERLSGSVQLSAI
jgi:hypothetical protein